MDGLTRTQLKKLARNLMHYFVEDVVPDAVLELEDEIGRRLTDDEHSVLLHELVLELKPSLRSVLGDGCFALQRRQRAGPACHARGRIQALPVPGRR